MRRLIRTPRLAGRAAVAGLICAALVAIAGLTSCSARQQVLLHGNGSGNVQFRVAISKSLMDAAGGLSQASAGAQKPGEFDIPKIKAVFSKNPSLKLESLSSPSAGVLAGSFSFTDINKLFQNQGGSAVVQYVQGSAGNRFEVHITRSNFADIAKLAGMDTNPLYQMFGPEQNAATTESDLDQMMVYVLGDSGPAALKASAIDFVVKVDGKITAQTGGVVEGNSVHFHIPLVQLLLLAKPLDYSVTFS